MLGLLDNMRFYKRFLSGQFFFFFLFFQNNRVVTGPNGSQMWVK